MFWSWFVWDQVQQKLVQINFKCDLNNKKRGVGLQANALAAAACCWLANLWRAAAHMHAAAAAQRAGGAAAL
jgi:hypothetical protein